MGKVPSPAPAGPKPAASPAPPPPRGCRAGACPVEIRIDPAKFGRALGTAAVYSLQGRGLVAAAVARLNESGHAELAEKLADHFETPRPASTIRRPEVR